MDPKDRTVLELATNTENGLFSIATVRTMLINDLSRHRFNRERAEEVFAMAIDHAVVSWYGPMKRYHGTLMPKQIRAEYARELGSGLID